MCCLAEFIVKYVLIIGNVIFSIAGLGIAGLGIAALVQLNQITDIIPVNLTPISIGIIVLGLVVFAISYLACCGAMRESICMLVTYSIFMAILAGIQIYVAVIVFGFLGDAQSTVDDWISTAFNNQNLRPGFHAMEVFFRCCGTVGASSYDGTVVPPSCCATPINDQCSANDSFGGCSDRIGSWFESFGAAIGWVLLIIIVMELVCMIFGFHMSNTIRNNRKRQSN